MDYLPQPSRAYPHVRIPFVKQIDFDGGDFATFPHRCGFAQDLDSCSEDELASLAQSWLYFGTLETFLRTKVNRNDFRAEDDHVLGSSLLELLSRWLETTVMPILGPDTAAKSPSSAVEQLLGHVTATVEFLEGVIRQADVLETLHQASTGALPAVLLSVRVLVATLSGVLDESVNQVDIGNFVEAYEPGRIERLRFISTTSHQPRQASAKRLLEDMVSNGWCPYLARKLCLTYNYVAAYYLSRLRGYYDISHRNCSEVACVAHNVDMSNYHTKHTTKECQCSHVHVDRDQVHSIISNGGIPIISFKKVEGQTELEVRKMTHKTSYVAFSHVWADGLGNATSNSLPRCQIEKLARYLQELELPKMAAAQAIVNLGPMKMDLQRMTRDLEISSFWLDTLCIPVGDDFLDLKAKAINSMAAIYAGALQVLVLDSTLEQLSIKSPDVEVCEMLGRVSISPWMGRSWTFQEGAISAIRQIRCLESSFNPTAVRFGYPSLFTRILDPSSLAEWLPSAVDALKAFARILHADGESTTDYTRRFFTYMSPDIKVPLVALIARPLKDSMVKEFLGSKLMDVEYDRPYDRFVACWNALCSRTTTKQEDVHLIFANILGFSASMVWEISDPADRMAALLLSLPYIPLSLFFSNTSVRDRHEENHFNRWMPVFPSGEPVEMFPRVKISETGLRLSSAPGSSEKSTDEEVDDNIIYPPAPVAFRINSRLEGITRQDVSLEGISKKLRPMISFHRSENDSFAASLGKGESFLVFSNESTVYQRTTGQGVGDITFRGALFQILNDTPADLSSHDKTQNVAKYRVAFDCSVSATLATDGGRDSDASPPEEGPSIQASLLPEPWQLDICTNSSDLDLPLQARPQTLIWVAPAAGQFLILWFLWILDIISMILLIAICATKSASFSSFTLAVVIVYFIVKAIPAPFILVALPVVVPYLFDISGATMAALYILSRHLSDNDPLDALELVFAVLAILISTLEISVRTLYKFYVSRKIYNAWLDTFDQSWSLDKETGWTKVVRKVGEMMSN